MSEKAPQPIISEAPLSLDEARARLRGLEQDVSVAEQSPADEYRQLRQTLTVVSKTFSSLPRKHTKEDRFAKTKAALEQAGIVTSDKPGKFWADIRDMRTRVKELSHELATAQPAEKEKTEPKEVAPQAVVPKSEHPADATPDKIQVSQEPKSNAALEDLVNFDVNLAAHHEKGTSGRRAGAFMSRDDLRKINTWQDEIRSGLDDRQRENEIMEQAKAFRPALAGIESALAANADKIADDSSSVTEIGLIRAELVKNGVASSLDVGNMSDDYIQRMIAYARPIAKVPRRETNPETGVASREFAIGETVKVLRTSGVMEDGWYVKQKLDGDKYFVVFDASNDSRLTKTVAGSSLRLWNDLAADAPRVTNPDAPARDAIVDGLSVTNPDAPAHEAIVVSRGVTNPDAPASDAVIDTVGVTNPDAPAHDAVIDLPENSLELTALRYELEAARNTYAKFEAKRQSRVGDYKGLRAIHGYNAAREAYLAKRIEYGKVLTRSAVEAANNKSEQNAVAIRYFIEQENLLRAKTNEFTSETRAQKFVHWMNKGSKKQRFLRYALIGAGATVAGAAIGSAGIGLGLAGGIAAGSRYIRGWGSKAGRRMDDVSVDQNKVDQRMRLNSDEAGDIDVAADIFSNYFESDAKREQKKNRKAIRTGAMFVGGGALAGYALQAGFDSFFGGGDTVTATVESSTDTPATPEVKVVGADSGDAGYGQPTTPELHEFANIDNVYNVRAGEGFYETFKDMGIPQDQWAEVLKDAGPELEKQGWSYFDNTAGEWRIAKPGQFPESAISVLKDASAAHGFTFR